MPEPIELSVIPLGAGDLIDRAVRFYRKFFWTFVLIASPPVVLGTMISVVWNLAARKLFGTGLDRNTFDVTFYFMFLYAGTVLIWLTETIATLVVMGGASRNFVRHLLFGEAITFGETYRNTLTRLPGLIVASAMIAILLGTLGFGIFYFGITVAVLAVILIAWLFSSIPILAIILSIIIGGGIIFAAIWLFFLAASRLAYVPQVMLVEGQGVFAAIGRSASLASGNVRRLAALFVFTTVAAYSALLLLFVPLAWYASANGVDILTFSRDLVPAWYQIASSLVWQLSIILLSPVWMIGLCLLYVDERVRGEGYDIELMAARRLGEIPGVPDTYANPLQPALASATVAGPSTESVTRSSVTTLGLK